MKKTIIESLRILLLALIFSFGVSMVYAVWNGPIQTPPGGNVTSAYAPINSPTFTGTVVLPSTTSIGTVSSTEIGYLDGVTSSIQTQIGAAATALSSHEADTTNIHGIADTSLLATTDNVATAKTEAIAAAGTAADTKV